MFSKRYATFEIWLEKTKSNRSGKTFKRIVAGHKKYPSATLKTLRGHKPKIVFESYRYTLGTHVTDSMPAYGSHERKPKKLSWTGYYFSDEEFAYGDEKRCYGKFAAWVEITLRHRHPNKNYDLQDVITDWGGYVREETNALVSHVKDGSYVHEFRTDETVRESEKGDWRY